MKSIILSTNSNEDMIHFKLGGVLSGYNILVKVRKK